MRIVALIFGAAALTGCATARPIETATIECEVTNGVGELSNCALLSQSVPGSSCGAFALPRARTGKYAAERPQDGQKMVQFTVRGRAGD